ncbi:MAG: flavin oxidoreductase [Myxococcales bacterium]|nr:flavin oxidoreductase [Myxococcales bacterium]|tara:strand:+ start:828 stop:1514 length:687 start_codon:yes stop_codon:yes gene_type:complete
MNENKNKRSFWISTDWEQWPERERARTMNSLSGFKSANLVGTSDKHGLSNLSMVSSVVHLGSSPALLGMVLRPPGANNAHTYKNLISTGQCTYSHVNEAIFLKAHQCSARYPKEVSEFDAVGLTPWLPPGIDWQAPAVAEANIRMGLQLSEDIPLPNGCRFMVCALQWVELPTDACASDGYIAIDQAESLTISGLDGYHQTTSLGRLSYAKVDQPVQVITDRLKGWED